MEKQHFTNTPYDIDRVIVSQRKTVDGKWACLYSLWSTVDEKVKLIHAQDQLRKANKAFYESVVAETSHASVLDKNSCAYSLAEMAASQANFDLNLQAAEIELSHIRKRMDEINPHCIHKDRPILERIMEVQEVEWEHEFRERISHYTLAAICSAIPHDQIAGMLTHKNLAPAMNMIVQGIAQEVKAVWDPQKSDTKVSLDFGGMQQLLQDAAKARGAASNT
jgi:hypothetical protein